MIPCAESPHVEHTTQEDGPTPTFTHMEFNKMVTLENPSAIRIIKAVDGEQPLEIEPEAISLSEDGHTLLIEHEAFGKPFESEAWYTIYLGEGVVADARESSILNGADSSVFYP